MKLNIHLATSAALAIFALAGPGSAAEYPSEPIKIVHGSSAGAPQDVMLRELAQAMEKAAGVPVVVEPRPGGTGQVAMAYLSGQPADGHTIFSDATGITSVLQMPGSAYDWTDFEPVYRIQLDPFALYVRRDGEYQSLEDLVAAMEANPEQIRIGGYGTASPHQFTALALADEAGVEFTWVPHNSGTDAIAAVMAGDLEAAMSNISVYNRFKDNTEVVAITSDERLESFPDTPTFQEQGYPIARYHWRGMFAKDGTPDEVLDRLHEIVGEAVESEAFQQYLAGTATIDGSMSRADFQAMLEEQAASDRSRMIELGMIEE